MNRDSVGYLICSLLLATMAAWSGVARGEAVVLIHGWSSDPDQWLRSGVVAALARDGWQDLGPVVAFPDGVRLVRPPYPIMKSGRGVVYRPLLPDRAPLQLQADLLGSIVHQVGRWHPGEPITLAGHSQGGVVVRLLLASRPELVGSPVDRLVTIATPHHGTDRAADALESGFGRPFFCPGPGFDVMRGIFGGSTVHHLRNSRLALADLVPVPGGLLDWLNRQPLPAIELHTLVRSADRVVPPASQRLPQHLAAGVKLHEHPTPPGHSLTPIDGLVLASILRDEIASTSTSGQ